MDDIEMMASVVNVLGILVCATGIFIGLYFVGTDGYNLFIKYKEKQ